MSLKPLVAAGVKSVRSAKAAEVAETAAQTAKQVLGTTEVAAPWSAKATSKAGGAVAQLADLDVALRDVESLRIVLTSDAKPADVAKLANEGARLLKLNAELRGLDDLSQASAQTKAEVVKIVRSLTAPGAQRKGIFLSKEGASVDIQGPSDLAAARAVEKKAARGMATGVAIGVDPATGARVVLQPKGRVIEDLPLERFVKLRAARTEHEAQAAKLAADETGLRALRTLTDEELDAKGLRSAGGPTEYVTLGGEKATDQVLTFPTRWHRGSTDLAARRMVVDGPFRGSYLDDVVGRVDQASLQAQVKETRAAWLSPKNSPLQPVISTIDVRQGGQTVKKLRIRVPSGSEWTGARQALNKISEKLPTVQKVANSKGTMYVFSPSELKFVREVTRSYAMSPEAELLRANHVEDLLKFERLASPENLKNFSAAKIGGLRQTFIDPNGVERTFELSSSQRVALARLANQNFSGVVTLGTGMGKTVVGLSTLKMIQATGETRPFLVVVPKGNEGTFYAQLQTHFSGPVAESMAKQLKVMSYEEFRAASRTGKLPDGTAFKSDKYGAVIFDEVHNVSDRKTAMGSSVLKFGHPRTIEMTGTPQPDPERLQTMLAGTKGVDLSSPAARQARLEARRFRALHYEEVNGIAVGLKGPTELKPGMSFDFDGQLLEWIKPNFFYVDGLDAKLGLPQRHHVRMTLPMGTELEGQYRKAAAPARKGLEGLLSIYRDGGVDVANPAKRTAQSRGDAVHEVRRSLKPTIAELDKLTKTPEKLKEVGKMLRQRLGSDEVAGRPLSRTLLFDDDPKYILQSAEEMSRALPGKYHLAALPDRIEVFQNGKRLTQLGPHALPFRQGSYELNGVRLPPSQWRSFVLEQLPKQVTDISSASLHGPTHQAGLNLQWSNVVVNLDRDGWSDLNMRQREARSLRHGQTRDVTVVNVDYVYQQPKHELDAPLEAVRAASAENERKLHEATLARAQKIKLTDNQAPQRARGSYDPKAWRDLTYLAAGASPAPMAVGLAGVAP